MIRQYDTLIQTQEKLYDFFFGIVADNKPNERLMKSKLMNGVMVGSDIRRDTLVSKLQGKITIQGREFSIIFTPMDDGVWLAKIIIS